MSTTTTHNDNKTSLRGTKQTQPLVPVLRFKEFDGDWNEKKLGDISNFLDGRRKPIKSSDRTKMKGEYPYYGASGIIDYVNKYIFDEELILLGEDGENIVSRNSPLAFRVSGKCWINNHAHVIVPKEGSDIDFMAHNLERINYLIYNTGTAQPKLNQEVCRKIPLITPTLPEQQKIASFLSAVDEKIQQLTAKKNLLEQYKKGVMQKLFSGKIRFKDENGNDFPDWEEKRLGEYLIHKSTKNKDLQVPLVLSVSNKKGFISQNEQFDGYEVASKDLSNYKIVYRDDIAYNPSRINVGSIARLINFKQGIVSPMYVVFSLKNGLDIIFFENLYSIHRFKHLIKVGCSGSVRDSLNFDDLCDFTFNIPSIKEQQKIATYLSSLDTKIETVNKRITQTQTFKKGLLQQMFV